MSDDEFRRLLARWRVWYYGPRLHSLGIAPVGGRAELMDDEDIARWDTFFQDLPRPVRELISLAYLDLGMEKTKYGTQKCRYYTLLNHSIETARAMFEKEAA